MVVYGCRAGVADAGGNQPCRQRARPVTRAGLAWAHVASFQQGLAAQEQRGESGAEEGFTRSGLHLAEVTGKWALKGTPRAVGWITKDETAERGCCLEDREGARRSQVAEGQRVGRAEGGAGRRKVLSNGPVLDGRPGAWTADLAPRDGPQGGGEAWQHVSGRSPA